MSAADELHAFWVGVGQEWSRGNREENIVRVCCIAGRVITATVLYRSGATIWKLNGKRASFGAIHKALRAAEGVAP